MKTAISLPDELFAIAEQFAARRGLSRSELYATALREYIEAHGDDGLVNRINAVCEAVDTSLPRDLADAARRAMKKADW